ncbi:MAG: Fe-S cluster assembly ATPase SufC [Candidatus Moraniibacteriota bacterium]
MLSLQNLSVSVEGKKILHTFNFDFLPGKTYVLMGPNGSGKSTLASAIMGHPKYRLSQTSKMLIGGRNLKKLSPDERAQLGVFLSFQTPMELAGVTVFELLRLALEKKIAPVELHKLVAKYANELRIKDDLLKRSLNAGFSGGEKKKLEALQAVLLQPHFAIFDEIDTGVDVDALKTITLFLAKHLSKETTLVFITHSTRLLKAIRPDTVLILKDGHLMKTGTAALAKQIEAKGFDSIK